MDSQQPDQDPDPDRAADPAKNAPPPALPEISASTDVDLPPDSLGQPDATKQVQDPEGEHRRILDRTKLNFAIMFASATALGAVLIGGVEYFTPELAAQSAGSFAATGDVLKLLATTSLGFIFGRTVGANDS